MEAALGTLVPTLARLGGVGLKRALAKPLLRLRVSWRVWKRARRDGIGVSRTAVYGWLARRDVRDQLCEANVESVESAMRNLAWRIDGTSEANAVKVVGYVLDEYLRALPAQDAIATGLARTTRQISAVSAAIRADIGSIPNAVNERTAAFDRDLLELHPWRTPRAVEIAARWPAVCDLAHLLASSPNRGQVLKDWAANPPAQLSEAPPETCLWLGELASDYGQKRAAIGLYELGIGRGAPSDYWWARAALTLNQEQDEPEMRSLLAKAGRDHPLAQATLLHLDHDYLAAQTTLASWAPNEPIDRILRAILMSVAAMGQGEMDRAIEVLEDAVQADPESSGVGLRAAELLLSRAQFGVPVSVLGDYSRARQLAIAARDSRRRWAGDSVAAILVALKATALAGDLDGARRLLTVAPDGEATPAEAVDTRLTGERAKLAALLGEESTALDLLDSVDNKHVESMVRGWIAHGKGEYALATEQWLEGWQRADGDLERIEAASALAPLGQAMPDLSDLAERHPEKVTEIRTIHDVMSVPGERLPLLRARAHESEELTMQLVAELSETGDLRGAAEVLREAGLRRKHPLMMRMSAKRLLAAGDYEAALARCADALQLAGQAWAGELETLEIMFEGYEALARHDDGLLVARRMVELAPQNLSARWVLVQCLVRNGDLELAWVALRYRGEPVSPRTPREVRTWIGLLAKFDASPFFLNRALGVFESWSADEELQGVILANIYCRSGVRDLTQPEIEALRAATGRFIAEHSASSAFRGVATDSESDPLKAIEDELKQHAPGAELVELELKIRNGELPLGFGAELFNRSYAECAIIQVSGLVYSDSDSIADAGKVAVNQALSSPVVIDTTAAVTLARLEESTSQRLIGAFSFVDATVVTYRDALGAQESLAMKSTMSIHWSDEAQKVVVNQIPDELAEARSDCAERLLSLLQGMRRVSWPRLRHLNEMGEEASWLSAPDFALEMGSAFWCDDHLLRAIAMEKGISSFSTLDLIRHLVSIGQFSRELGQVAESVLLANYHVDLGFDQQAMQLAATMDNWEPAGAAANLARPASWQDGQAALAFLMDAIKMNAERNPAAVQRWVQLAAEGVIRVAGDNSKGAYDNVRLILVGSIGATNQVNALLPFLAAGIRLTLAKFPVVADPVEEVLRGIHTRMVEKFGYPGAASLLLGMVSNASSEDQALAARIILTMST